MDRERCWCGGMLAEEAAAGVYRCVMCGEMTNDWDEEDDDAQQDD